MPKRSSRAANKAAPASPGTGSAPPGTDGSNLPVNPKARAIYLFLVRHARTHRLPPTRQEIADGTGIPSTGTVQRYLEILRSQGRIQIEPGTARGIFVDADNGPGTNQG